VVPGNLQLYVETYAHAHLDPEAVAAAREAIAAAAASSTPGGPSNPKVATARKPFGNGGVGSKPPPGAPPAKPPAPEEVPVEADPDADCDGNVLRECVRVEWGGWWLRCSGW